MVYKMTSALQKNKTGAGHRKWGGKGKMVEILNTVLRGVFTEKVTFELTPEGSVKVSQVPTWGKSLPDRGDNKNAIFFWKTSLPPACL